jgi:hypothetical protein
MESDTKAHYLLLVLFFAIYLLCGEIGSLISILVGLAPPMLLLLLETGVNQLEIPENYYWSLKADYWEVNSI